MKKYQILLQIQHMIILNGKLEFLKYLYYVERDMSFKGLFKNKSARIIIIFIT